MTNVAAGWAIVGAVRHSTSAPRLISHENGRKNFTDAAAHNQYRTRASCRRSASVTSQTKATTSVDCHT